MKRSLFICLVSGFWLLVSPSHAIIDTNTNGVSDPWERRNNSGNLIVDFDPTADPDGDGWTNEQEAVTGTDPFDGNAPIGFLRPEIEHLPAVYITPEVEGGEPEILSPETTTITWPTLAGKQYTLFASADLSPGSWTIIGTPDIGNGTEMATAISLTQSDGSIPNKLFLRISVLDVDQDSDTLTNAEEAELGSLPYSADGDNDGLNDLEELFTYLTSPISRDSDGDGVSDPDEIILNFTNPLSNIDGDSDGIPDDQEKHLAKQFRSFQSDPAAWGAFYTGLLAGDLTATHDYTGENITAGQLAALLRGAPTAGPSSSEYLVEPQKRRNLIPWAYHIPPRNSWPTENIGQYWHSRPGNYYAQLTIVPWADFTLASLSQYLVSRIDSVEWDQYGTANGLVDWNPELAFYWSEAMSGITESPVAASNATRYQGNIIQKKFRVIATRADHEALSQHFLKVTSKLPDYDWGIGEVVSAEPFPIRIPKGKFFSDWFNFAVDMTNGVYTTVRLLPVELEVRKKGELAAQATGLLVKKGDSLEIALAPQFFDSEDNFESLITWQYRQLKGDGSYTPWTAFGANATGTKFEHVTTAGGIFQVKALINGAGEHEYKRRNDAPHGANSAGTYNEKLRKGELDFVGVVEKDIQIPIRNQAMVLLGSAAYAKSGALLVGFGVDPTLDFRGSWKCNIFVFQVSNFMSLSVGTKTWRDYRFGVPPYTDRQVPPGANDWYNSTFSIPSWIWVASSTLPQPGYVAIHQHTSDPVSGGAHMGVLDYDGTWINAGATRVNKSIHVSDASYQPTNYRKP